MENQYKDNHPDTRLSMRHEMRHSHRAGYTPEESCWFADRIVNGEPVPRISVRYEVKRMFYSCTEEPEGVRLFYITERMSFAVREKYGQTGTFMEQQWQFADLDPGSGEAILPGNAVGKYVEFTLPNGVVLTSAYAE